MWASAWSNIFKGMKFGQYISSELRFPAEPELWDRLRTATTAAEVRVVCEKSEYWLNPQRGASLFNNTLMKFADEVVVARRHPRYPKSSRPTSEGRQMQFLARVLAGLLVGLSP